jgi:hypothetical protein
MGLCNGLASGAYCAPDPEHPTQQVHYVADSGTSMAAPQVSGAVAVVQSAAMAKLGRYLTPAEVKDVLVSTATRMTRLDGLASWPCGIVLRECGEVGSLYTGEPYEAWQVGAGMLSVEKAVAAVDALSP